MVLGLDILLRLVEEKKLIEHLGERELNNPEGAGFDLRIGELHDLKGAGYLDIDTRSTSPTERIAAYVEGQTQRVTISRQQYYLVKTIERVNLPENILAYVSGRTTLFRCGVKLETAAVAPGYCGELTFGLHNAGEFDFTLEMGARIAHITFHEVAGETRHYRGQWRGGRVSTEGSEVQT